MLLNQYPTAIAQASHTANELDCEIAETRTAIADIELEIDQEIAFGDFKNDAQRKTARLVNLAGHQRYLVLQSRLNNLLTSRAAAAVELEKLRNAFSVAKLETRFQIAQLVATSEDRELVGLYP
jgi:DNA-binding sugar fermentation-stimulating protein